MQNQKIKQNNPEKPTILHKQQAEKDKQCLYD